HWNSPKAIPDYYNEAREHSPRKMPHWNSPKAIPDYYNEAREHSPRKMPHWNSPLPVGIGRGDGVNECVTRLKI
ncbi:MAG: hypothetical protein KA314_29930, partial [Chloroflexi bacterium]|nr:hypothetical protein [Chloroflexota bacterium]